MKRMIVAIAITAALSQSSQAAGTSAAQFLKMGAGARASAMGEAFVAVANDANATYWNPAGLTKVEKAEVSVMQNSHFVDTNYQFLGAALPLESLSLGASFARLDYGSIQGYDDNDAKTKNFDAGSMSGGLSAAKKFGDKLALGLTAKFVQEKIENESASTLAADVGAMYTLNRFQIGGAIQHLGGSLSMVKDSAPLPMTVRAGVSTMLFEEKLLVAGEVSKPNDHDAALHAGTEYKVTPQFTVRGGYKAILGDNADLGGLVGINAGLGIQVNRFNLDYSISPFGDLGLSHRISLRVQFN